MCVARRVRSFTQVQKNYLTSHHDVRIITKREKHGRVDSKFKYRDKAHPERGMIIVGQREDTSLYLDSAHHLEPEQNRFRSIEQIEEYLDMELEMIIRPN